jgi:DNA-directed RNA polymerase specialized sigma24 family protein
MDLSERQVKKLVEDCIGNERSAQETLYKIFYAQMLRICYRYLRSNELAFDAKKGDLGGWICTVMIRTAIDNSRKELKFSTISYADQDTDEYFIDPNVLSKLYAEDLLRYTRQLPDATRVIFNLAVIDGYSHKEIGAQLQITESTSRWHLAEAKKKLRLLLTMAEESTGKPTDNYKAK